MFQRTIVSVIKEYFWQSTKRMPKEHGKAFEQESYSRWAAKEILTEIENNPDVSPLETVEKFRDKMDQYACSNKNSSYIFSVAYDMAQEILNLFL